MAIFLFLENWDPYANFEYKTISLQFNGAEIFTKQNGACDKGNRIELAFFFIFVSQEFLKM